MREDTFVGREDELSQLHSLMKKKSASLVVLRGRRRVGKSRLIEEFAREQNFFAFSGIPPNPGIDAQEQRNIFSSQLGKKIGIMGIESNDWSTLFSLLAKETQKGRVVILFDEISWMGSKDPTFLGKLKNAWDLEFKKNHELILILCGSVSIWIEENIISNTAFFGRISLLIKLKELSLSESNHLLKERGYRGSATEVFNLLSITGGIPWYLEQVKAKMNADENIKDLCFRQAGVLFREFESIFHDLFAKRGTMYRHIVEKLADGAMELKVLSKALKMPLSGTLTTYLRDLIESGFISRDYTWKVRSGQASSLSQYRLSDNYLRFYVKHIAPNKDKVERGRFDDVNLSSMPGWYSMMGLQFENLVLKNRQFIWDRLNLRSSDIIADNPYFQKKTVKQEGSQVDYLIQTRFNTLFACEVKFSSHPVGKEVISQLKTKLAKIQLPKRFSIWPVLVHVNGVSDPLRDTGYFSEIIDFSEFLLCRDP